MTGPILLLGDRDGTITQRLHDVRDLEAVGDLDRCLERTTSLRAAGRPPRLVALAPDLPQPLAAVRRVRQLDAAIGVAVLVGPSEVPATEAKLAFVPDLRDVVVIASEPVGRMAQDLRRAAHDAEQRTRLVHALDAINEQLRRSRPVEDEPRRIREGVSERYLATLIRHAPDAIIAVDQDERVVTVNPAAVLVLGLYTDPEGRPIDEVVPAEDPGLLRGMMNDVGRGRVHEGIELMIVRQGDERVLLSITAAPVAGTGDVPAGSVLVARDITAQRRADEQLRQLQRAEGLATLAGGVAHDFNNLLMTIHGWATIAGQDPHDAEMVETSLAHISVAAERAGELARAMLAYSGRSESAQRACDLNGLVEGMRGLFDASVPKGIVVEVELADDLPKVHADPTQLRQVILNLVTNAAEAIGDGAGRIEIATRFDAPGDDGVERVELEVTDTGHGMDELTVARIFEPFFTTRFTGRGLGLAATLGIVRAHGGAITVDSEPGQGTRFTVTLPVASAQRSP